MAGVGGKGGACVRCFTYTPPLPLFYDFGQVVPLRRGRPLNLYIVVHFCQFYSALRIGITVFVLKCFLGEIYGETRSHFSAFGAMFFWVHVRMHPPASTAINLFRRVGCLFVHCRFCFVNSSLVCSVQSFLHRQQWNRLFIRQLRRGPRFAYSHIWFVYARLMMGHIMVWAPSVHCPSVR